MPVLSLFLFLFFSLFFNDLSLNTKHSTTFWKWATSFVFFHSDINMDAGQLKKLLFSQQATSQKGDSSVKRPPLITLTVTALTHDGNGQVGLVFATSGYEMEVSRLFSWPANYGGKTIASAQDFCKPATPGRNPRGQAWRWQNGVI